MIKNVQIKNFKTFKEEATIELKKLNILSGLNSGGKSSVYQVLLLLAQSSEETLEINGNFIPILKMNGKFVNLGAPKDILSNKEDNLLEIRIEWEDETDILLTYELLKQKNKSKSQFILKEIALNVQKGKYYVVSRNNDFTWSIIGKGVFAFADGDIARLLSETGLELNETVEFEKVEPTFMLSNNLFEFEMNKEDIKNCIAPKDRDKFNYEEFLENLKQEKYTEETIVLRNAYHASFYKKMLSGHNIVYIPPFRGIPKRIYTIDNPLEEMLEFDKEEIITYDYDLKTGEKKEGNIAEALKYWVINKFKIADDIEVREPIDHLVSEIIFTKGTKKISLNNLGFGVSQIIPVLFKVLNSSKKELVIIDEPEIHLHPHYQSLLGEFFYKMMKLNKNQIIETHSEYLIDKLIYLYLKYDYGKECEYLMYWIEKSKIEEIKFDDLGFIKNSPKYFLSEKDKMMEELAELRMERL